MALMTASIGKELIEAFGLPPGRVSDLQLHFPADGIVTATVELMPERDQLDKVVSILKCYELHEKQDASTNVDELVEVQR